MLQYNVFAPANFLHMGNVQKQKTEAAGRIYDNNFLAWASSDWPAPTFNMAKENLC